MPMYAQLFLFASRWLMHDHQQLNVDVAEVEELLIGLILEGKVEGKIDQVAMRLELDQQCVIVPHAIFVSVVGSPRASTQTRPGQAPLHGAREMDRRAGGRALGYPGQDSWERAWWGRRSADDAPWRRRV